MKNKLFWLVLVVLMLMVMGCEADTNVELSTYEYAPTAEHVRLLGRAKEVDNTIWMAHSGTGAEFKFRGTKATITLCADSAVNNGEDNQARVAIYVNGKRVVDDMLDAEKKTYSCGIQQ